MYYISCHSYDILNYQFPKFIIVKIKMDFSFVFLCNARFFGYYANLKLSAIYIYISDFCLLIDILWFQLYKIDKIKDQENQNEIKS